MTTSGILSCPHRLSTSEEGSSEEQALAKPVEEALDMEKLDKDEPDEAELDEGMGGNGPIMEKSDATSESEPSPSPTSRYLENGRRVTNV